MITSIEITNCKSIKKARLDFTKGKYKYLTQYVLNESVANPIAIYGYNGSGKSSFWEAIHCMIALMIADKDKLAPFMPNIAGTDMETAVTKKSGISISFVLDKDKYCYSIYTACVFTERSPKFGISDESLTVNDKTVFSRSLEKIEVKEKNRTITTSISLFPALRSLFSENDDKFINKSYSYLSNLVVNLACSHGYLSKSLSNEKQMDVIEEKSDEVKKILETYKSFPLYNVISNIATNGQKFYSAAIDIGENKPMVLPYEYISRGMQNQSFLLTLLLTMPEGGALFVDELEVALHPATIMNFIDLVVKKNIQLIFTSHNTFILSKLRPDNVVFAHWEKGCSSFSRLSDIYPNIREINNIEKMYLSSTFDEEIEKAR